MTERDYQQSPEKPLRGQPAPSRIPMPSVAEIETMQRSDLLSLWRDINNCSPPKRLSSPMLRRMLAFDIQAGRQGGISASLQRKLDRINNDNAKPPNPKLKPGGRLIREWNGITHVIDVTESGYSWKGQKYRSLSAIARSITGAHWSGPRFFGLTNETSP